MSSQKELNLIFEMTHFWGHSRFPTPHLQSSTPHTTFLEIEGELVDSYNLKGYAKVVYVQLISTEADTTNLNIVMTDNVAHVSTTADMKLKFRFMKLYGTFRNGARHLIPTPNN